MYLNRFRTDLRKFWKAWLLVDYSIVKMGFEMNWLIAPMTVMPRPLLRPIGYLTGSIFGVQVFLFLSQRLNDASSKYISGRPSAITLASRTAKASTASGERLIAC